MFMIFGAFATLGVIPCVWESQKSAQITNHSLRIHNPFSHSELRLDEINSVTIGKQFVVVETYDQGRRLIPFTLKNIGVLARMLQQHIDQRNSRV